MALKKNDKRMTITQVRRALAEQSFSEADLSAWRGDDRAGVQGLLASYERRCAAEQREEERLTALLRHERLLTEKNLAPVVGLDEAGRGPLAGPVAVGAVILPSNARIPGLNDSKKLTREKRRELFLLIQETALAYEVVLVDHHVIDEMGVHKAVFAAMRHAIGALGLKPASALVDGFQLPHSPVPSEGLINGDARSASIAAASILAKECRDRRMEELDGVYPEYGFARHKGYGTAEHVEALREHGPSPIHRMSFKIVSEACGSFSYLRSALERAVDERMLLRAGQLIKEHKDMLSAEQVKSLRRIYAERREALGGL